MNVPSMLTATTAANLALHNSMHNSNSSNNKEMDVEREFVVDPSDIGKYLVMSFRYEQHLFYGHLFGTQLIINGHKFESNDSLYAVYKIDWYSDYYKGTNDVSYKIKLTPIEEWQPWCPNRAWYTSDVESMVNREYELTHECPLFDNYNDARKFAIKKNIELYPKKSTIIDKIKNLFK